MSNGWTFYRDAGECWRWKYVMHGRTVAQAHHGHKQYAECIAEARVHGYREEPAASDVRDKVRRSR